MKMKKIEGGKWKAGGGSLLAAVGVTSQLSSRKEDQALDEGEGQGDGFRMKLRRVGVASFTLVEILVVISIIGLLAGISIPAVGGAMNAARKAKVSAMAQQVRTAITQFNTEYGYFPTNGLNGGSGSTGSSLALVLAGMDTNSNPRQIVFLEVPLDFTVGAQGNLSNQGIVTPRGFYANNAQSNLSVAVDHNYDGLVSVINDTTPTNIRATTAVWYVDPKNSKKTIGTWK